MDAFNYELKGGEELMALWAHAPEIVERELTQGMETSLALLQREVVDATPKKTGILAGSIIASPVEIGGQEIAGFVGTPITYAIPVELGTGPHVIKAKDGGLLYFMFNGHLIGVKSVNHPGTPAFGMFHRSLTAQQPAIEEYFVQASARIVAQLGGAA